MLVLLTALVDLDDRVPTKREVWKFIEKMQWLNLPPDLLKESYESKEGEPEWVTILCFQRQNAIEKRWMKPLKIRDAWEIDEEGRHMLARTMQWYRTPGRLTPSKYPFWSEHFRERMCKGGSQ